MRVFTDNAGRRYSLPGLLPLTNCSTFAAAFLVRLSGEFAA